MKIKFLFICLLMIPSLVFAETKEKFQINTGEDVTFEESVNGSSITVGTEVNSKGEVNGIDFNLGNILNYQGKSDYALLAGFTVNVEGVINNDGLIIGDVINFKDTFEGKRDLFIFGTTVNLKGNIDRNIIIYATNVNIESNIKGSVKVMATNIVVNEKTEIQGTLSYNEDAVIELKNNSIKVELLESISYEQSFSEKVTSYIMSLLGSLVLFVVLCFIVPKLFEKIEENKNKGVVDYFSLLGFGALAFILIPIVSLLMMTNPLLQPITFLILALYVIVLCLSNIFVGYLIGYIIWTKLIKKEENRYLIGLIGITALSILVIIPALGTLILLITMMINLGIIINLFKKN